VSGYLAAYLLTVGLEPPLYALALRLMGEPWRRGYGAALLANLSSHPLTWLVLYRLLPWSGLGALVVVEAFAVTWEAVLLRRLLRHDVAPLVGLSLVLNAVSIGVGALVLR
jgi:hypothetical protein